METIFCFLFFVWSGGTFLFALLICIGICFLVFGTGRKRKTRRSLVNPKVAGENKGELPAEVIPFETTASVEKECSVDNELVATPLQAAQHYLEVSHADKQQDNYLFQSFISIWLKKFGLELKLPVSKGDAFLVFEKEQLPGTNKMFSVIMVSLWKSVLIKGRVQWSRSYQMADYREFESSTGIAVFVAVGLGGEPGQPRAVHIIPLKNVRANVLSENQLGQNVLLLDDFYFDTKEMQFRSGLEDSNVSSLAEIE